MQQWNLSSPEVDAGPKILSSSDEGRAVFVQLAAGQEMGEHQVHERAWLTVLSGDVEIDLPHGAVTTATGPALLVFEPGERHGVRATTDASLLLLLTPWPGVGHPGATPLEIKNDAHRLSQEKQSAASP